MELCLLGGPPTALAGDQLVAPFGEWAYDHRLDHAAFRNRRREVGQRLFLEPAPGLLGMRLDRRHRNVGKARSSARGRDRLRLARRVVARTGDQRLLTTRLAKQGSEPSPELAAGRGPGVLAFLGAHAAFLSFGKRPI